MYKKILAIKGYGRFQNFNCKQSDWDGTLKKVNVIYAPNGSGKTSLAELFKSSLGDNSIIYKKKSFQMADADSPEIQLLLDDNKTLSYHNGKWNRHATKVEVFDSFYLEDNLYTISIEDSPQHPNIFELSARTEMMQIKDHIQTLNIEWSDLSTKIANRKLHLKKKHIEQKKDCVLQSLLQERQKRITAIKQANDERLEKTFEQREKYIHAINDYLSLFSDHMQIVQDKVLLNTQTHTQNLIYKLSIGGHEITEQQRRETSLKYFLSDGDKNALALSFFLARMNMLPELSSYVVVVDDPFTSFDTQRKMTTITQLSRLAKKVGQFILLTHDLHFANDFNNACDEQILNLKIQNHEGGSFFYEHDIHFEMLTGFSKDLMVLRRFLNGQVPEDQVNLREVIRCVRPSIEGLFRMKYFNYIGDNEWLGDVIKRIKDSDDHSPLNRLKSYIDELEEINDYSKIYHHSNPNYIEVGISPQELKVYVKRTLNLIEKL